MSAIHVENLGKRYRIGERVGYTGLRHVLDRALLAPFRMFRARKPASPNGGPTHIWALKGVSFDVRQGEVVGIIGRNGAGKSTLLKILARVTEPTEGFAEVRGRMGSMLEVGTGFHPELTGRENAFLSGAIMGMTKAEIERKFDEIVSFAEIEKFIGTPVKHYSSGMYLRLAFAVAAHLEPEILIIDEVLAVGDQRFQDKCLKKIGEVQHHGRTVLFVSHSMPAIQRLCTRALVLERGEIQLDSDPMSAIAGYLGENVDGAYRAQSLPDSPTITNAAVRLDNGVLLLSVDFKSPFPLTPPVLGFVMYDPVGTPVFGTNTRLDPPAAELPASAAGRIEVSIPTEHFRPHRYFFSLWLGDHYSDYCSIEKALQVDLHEDPLLGLPPQIIGSLRLPVRWDYRPAAECAPSRDTLPEGLATADAGRKKDKALAFRERGDRKAVREGGI
jgi:lipopolysaccharide transport system ATP-binding protein